MNTNIRSCGLVGCESADSNVLKRLKYTYKRFRTLLYLLLFCKSRYGSESLSSVRMTSQKLCEHVGRLASRTKREAYEWRGSTVLLC